EPDDDDIWSDRGGWRMQGPAWIRRTLEGDDGPVEGAGRAAAPGPPSIADLAASASAIEGGSGRGAGGAWEWEGGEASGVLTYEGELLSVDGGGRRVFSVGGAGCPAWGEAFAGCFDPSLWRRFRTAERGTRRSGWSMATSGP